jgi:predicted nucleotidyltransferase
LINDKKNAFLGVFGMLSFNMPKNVEKNGRVRGYVDALIDFFRRYMGENLVSVILFGSYVEGEVSKHLSDVDMIIVVDGKLDKKLIKKASNLIKILELKYGISNNCYSFFDKFLHALEKGTGMFISHFICKYDDFVNGNFSGIFSTNRILSKVLAPSEIVLATFQKKAQTIWGKDLLNEMRKPKITIIQLIKSCYMNFLLSVGALIISPFSKKAIKFSMEAVKWSLHSCSFCATGESKAVEKEGKNFIKNGICEKHIKRLISLRKKMATDIRFVLKTPITVLKIHQTTLKKLCNQKKRQKN